MQRIKKKLDKKIFGIPLINIVNAIVFILFIVLIIIICAIFRTKFVFADGQIELGYTYNSNLKNEKSSFSAIIEEKMDRLEFEIKSDFYKEQENKEIKALNINSDVQANYYYKKNIYYYSATRYDRNLEYGINDKTFFDFGMGYKDYGCRYPLRFQAGLSTGSIYYDDGDIEKNIFFSSQGALMVKVESIELKDEVTFTRNLKSVNHGDTELTNLASVKANLTSEFFLSFSLNSSFISDPPSDYPHHINIWMVRGGINF